ncbi:hypothetical protein [Spartinivicinus poritis]|uniref:Uncharacterized protein n=1 Tax=Spartinivicinus poritis TaxID=2994640 RepID=A0ABT5U5K1_9GAMM|nr:hypothetical protein [Spartinivicinus sp. A2-2]MDE1460469.1 hypothetical protein [Spartinivicinus sp. A2-2]
MNSEQQRVALLQPQPFGPRLFFRPAVLQVVYVEWLHGIPCALLDKKIVSGSGDSNSVNRP